MFATCHLANYALFLYSFRRKENFVDVDAVVDINNPKPKKVKLLYILLINSADSVSFYFITLC